MRYYIDTEFNGTGGQLLSLALVRDIGMAPDILLVDYQLDGDDTGVRAIQAIRAQTGVHVPAIMITAERGPELVRTGEELDFAVLTKPVQLARLRPLIDWKTRGGALEGRPPAADKSIA